MPLFLLLASTCKKVDSAGLKSIRLNAPFEMAINEKAIIQGKNAVIEITEITDNRCSADVQCFTARDAKLKLSITGIEANNGVLSFCIGQCDNRYRKADTLAIQYQDQRHTVILRGVNPYPEPEVKRKQLYLKLKKD